MGMMKPWHWIILILVILILFGTAKLPQIAKSIGQSAKVLKKEMKELQDDVPPEIENGCASSAANTSASSAAPTSSTAPTAQAVPAVQAASSASTASAHGSSAANTINGENHSTSARK